MRKISVIVPVYNMEKRLEVCLDSLVNQTYKNIEIIIINDGSSDSSFKIMQMYKNNYKNKIIIIDRENMGISFTRNEGIMQSTGYYIGFVDSDDFIELDMYEKMIQKIEKENADVAVCDCVWFTDNSSKYISVVENIINLKQNPKIINELDFGPCNKVYKKELFSGIVFPCNTKYEDLSTILKICYKAGKIVKLNKGFYHYYNNPNGETKTIDKKIYDIFKILDDILLFFKKENISEQFSDELQYLCINKVFIYCEISCQSKNVKFTLDFLKNSYLFINKNFKNWEFKYLKMAKGNKITRIMQLFPNIYKIKLILKIWRH